MFRRRVGISQCVTWHLSESTIRGLPSDGMEKSFVEDLSLQPIYIYIYIHAIHSFCWICGNFQIILLDESEVLFVVHQIDQTVWYLESNSWVFFLVLGMYGFAGKLHKSTNIGELVPSSERETFKKSKKCFLFDKFLAEESNVETGRMVG